MAVLDFNWEFLLCPERQRWRDEAEPIFVLNYYAQNGVTGAFLGTKSVFLGIVLNLFDIFVWKIVLKDT